MPSSAQAGPRFAIYQSTPPTEQFTSGDSKEAGQTEKGRRVYRRPFFIVSTISPPVESCGFGLALANPKCSTLSPSAWRTLVAGTRASAGRRPRDYLPVYV